MAVEDNCSMNGANGDTLQIDAIVSNESSDEGVEETTSDQHLLNGRTQSTPVPDTTIPKTDRSRPQYAVKYILSGHTMAISALKFSPDGTMLASSGAPFCPTNLLRAVDPENFGSKLPTNW
jgi:WD40 repeat protein